MLEEIYIKRREQADIIYYIKSTKFKSYFRVIKRWIKQKIGKEEYNIYPTVKQLLYFISIVTSYYKKEKHKLKELEEFQYKLVFINNRKIVHILMKNKCYS